jgi:hypothetical protein
MPRVLTSVNLQERNLVMRAALAIVVCSLATVACDGSSYPTSPEPANAFAKVSVITPASLTVSAFSCGGTQLVGPDLTLFVTASQSSLFVDTVTIHLVDGSNLSGESITFPRAGLDAQFGSTFIPFGNRRSFLFRPAFVCPTLPARAIVADVVLADEAGRRHSVSTTVSLH